MSGFQKGATYQEIKDYVKGQNYNLAKKENAKVPQCPTEKDEAIRAALEHFQMI